MSILMPEGFEKAIPKGLKTEYKKKDSSVELGPKIGFPEVSLKLPQNHRTKKVDDWNKKDTIQYFWSQYEGKYGRPLSRPIPYAAAYLALADITHMLEKQIKKDVPVSLIKEYFDFALDKLTNDLLVKKSGKFTLNDLRKEKHVLAFVMTLARPAPIPVKIEKPKVEKVVSTGFTLTDLETAAGIHSQYFIQNYGLVIPVNYLVLVKNKTVEDAVQYVKKALTKTKQAKEIEDIKAKTEFFGPYPKWLPFLAIEQLIEMKLSVSDDNTVFDILRSKDSK